MELENYYNIDNHSYNSRVEKIMMDYNLKECENNFKKGDRYIVDLRIGELFIIDSDGIDDASDILGSEIDWNKYHKDHVIKHMYNNTYNGYVNNYQYESYVKLCDELNKGLK